MNGLRAHQIANFEQFFQVRGAIINYESGNFDFALSGFRAAAAKGDAVAQFYLGLMYTFGEGVPKSDRIAISWYTKAAEQGHSGAQHNLGLRYASGRGVPKDDATAYFWFLLSSAQGDEDSRRMRENIEHRLTAQQRADAQALARVWKPVPAATAATALANPQTASSSSKPDSAGTGVRVARDRFVTNHHVVEDCRQVRIDGAAAKIAATDTRMDLALLSAPLSGPSVSIRASRSVVGEAVTVAGFPLQELLSSFQVTTGTLASLSGLGGDTSQFQITAPVQAGNSGGPVLDSAGRVIGIVVAKLNAIRTARATGDLPQNVNFAVGANALRSFLDASDVEYQTSLQGTPLLTTEVAQQAREFTVRVECWK